MLRHIKTYVVTGWDEGKPACREIVECQGEDPIVKICRKSAEMRKCGRINARLVDSKLRSIELYPKAKKSDISRDTSKPVDCIWTYVDARNEWRRRKQG